MFDGNEKEKPRGERKKILHHHPYAYAHHLAEHGEADAGQAVETVFCEVNAAAGVDDEKSRGHCLGHRGAYSRARYAKFRQTAFAEDKQVVENHVAQHHGHGVGGERAGVGRADVESAEHSVCAGEEETGDTEINICLGGAADFGRGDYPFEDGRGKGAGCEEENDRKQQQECRSVVEDAADAAVVALAISPSDKDLRSDAESQAKHEDGNIENAAESRSPQFDFVHVAQECRVGHTDELLHERAD